MLSAMQQLPCEPTSADPELSLVIQLTSALNQRQVARGTGLLNQASARLETLGPATPHAADLMLLIAQWVDVGYRDHRFLDTLLLNFPNEERRKLAVDDFLKLRMVEAFRALCVDEVDTTIILLNFVLQAQQEWPDAALITLAHFWKGRAHRKKGEYEAAFLDIVYARELSQKLENDTLTAVIQIQESWLLFQRGLKKEAWQLLNRAETVLKSTDHALALGNIESARGRIVRRAGEYTKALEHFDRAIDIYSPCYPDHRNLARALVNAAYVKRLVALQLRKRIDAMSPRQTEAARPEAQKLSNNGRMHLRARYQQICHEAIVQLKRAKEIYALHGAAGGVGAVILNVGYLHLDRGDIERAAQEALEAYQLGFEKNDQILMARARILQATMENAKVEEQVGEDVDTALHASQAKLYSEEALALARHTQNRRLLAGACIARGTTAANEFFQDWELAKRCASEATEHIGAGENDHLLDALAALKTRIMQASGINDTLREWSEGMVGNKTFQQITEEFAEIVIPKVWLREDKKVSRVAECLSISPKKVRRILRNAGHLHPR